MNRQIHIEPETAPATRTGLPSRPFWILPAIVIAQFAGSSIWFSGNAVLAQGIPSLGDSAAMAGWITAAVQLGFIAGTLLFAFLSISDRFSPRQVFFVCTLAAACCNLLTVWAFGPFEWLVLRLAVGFFIAGIYPVGMRIAAGWYARGLGNALGFLIGALVLGTAFPHWLNGGLLPLSWQLMMLITSGICLFGGLLMFLLVPDGPYLPTGTLFQPRAVFTLFRHRPLRAAAFGYFGHMWELYALWAFTPFFLEAYNRYRPEAILNISLWSFLIIAAGSLGCIFGGRASLRYGSDRVAAVLLTLSGLFCLASPWLFHAPPILFAGAMLLWGVVVVGDSPQFSTIVARSSPPALVGSALTLVNAIGFSVTVVSLSLLQWLADLVAPQYLLLVLAAGPALGLASMRPLLKSG